MQAQRPSALADPARIAALQEIGLLDTPPEESFDRLTRLTSSLLGAPIALMSLVDEERQFCKSALGLPEPWASEREIPLTHSFCRHTVEAEEVLVVGDAREHPWLWDNPAIEEIGMIAYLGTPIRAPDDQVLGTLCAIDHTPRAWTRQEVQTLQSLGELTDREIELCTIAPGAERQAHDGGEEAGEALRFRELVDQLLVGICIVQNGRFRYVNPKFARIFGYTPEEVVSAKSVLDLVPPDDQATVEEYLTRWGDGEPGRAQHLVRGVRRDGTPIELEVHARLTEIEGEAAFIGSFLDLAEWKTAEEVRESEERYRLVARATHDVLWDWDLASGELLWSEAAQRTFRYSPDELGSSIAWWYDRIHPEDRERVISRMHEAVDGVDDCWSDEYRFLRGDGSYVTVLDRASVVRDERGQAVRVIGSMSDVTERKRAEEAQRFLAQASKLLDETLDDRTTLVHLAHLAIPTLGDYCLIDLVGENGEIRRVAAAHTDREKEEILSHDERHPPDADPERHPVVKVVQTGEPVLVPEVNDSILQQLAHDEEHRRGLQEIGLRSFMIVPLIARGRRLGAITLAAADSHRHFTPADLILAADLAHRAALAIDNALLYKQAQQAIQARDEVLGVVSHDLRNPLNTIQLTATLLLDAAEERRSENVTWLEVIQRSAQQMNAMIGDLLDLSSLGSGHFTIACADHDVAALVTDACTLLEPLAHASSLRLEHEVASDLSTVWIDSKQILRVFSNLVGNAIKFTPEGGRISVGARRLGDEVCFSVRDTGPGIPAEQLPHVFDRYWQARHGDRRGAGLGLAIAKGIVEAHRGRIWAESEVGRGTTFRFTVPLRRSPEG